MTLYYNNEYGKHYIMGQQVRVKVVHVDKLARKIDFELVEDTDE